MGTNIDIRYLFTGYHGGPDGVPTTLTPVQQKLSDRMIDAWAAFARSGNPNGKADAPWPRWKKHGAAVFVQDNSWNRTQTAADFAADHNCGFWQSLLLYR